MSPLSFNLRSLHLRHALLLLIAAFFFIAQLGAASHPLHKDDIKGETSCAFCVSGTHLQSAPPIAIPVLAVFTPVVSAPEVHHVCDIQVPLSSRLTRGPPSLDTCV